MPGWSALLDAVILGDGGRLYSDIVDALVDAALNMATHAAARVLGAADYGVHIGALADLVVIDAGGTAEAVVARPPRRYVFKAGKLVAKDGAFMRH